MEMGERKMNGNEFRHNLQRIMDASLYYISNKPTNTFLYGSDLSAGG